MKQFYLLSFLLSLTTTSNVVCAVYHDYCVVGAGPGGLQISYFLQQAGRDYLTFEKGSAAGTFYTKYPIHRTLISINKRYTGKTNKEFNLRHDWNSLISHDDDLLMTKYSKEFFPPADSFVQYLNDYARKLRIKVQYNTTISNLSQRNSKDGLFHVNDQHDNEYKCKTVILATGIAVPNNVEFKGKNLVTDYSDLTLNKEQFSGHTILILGTANSAFESGQHIQSEANSIHFIGRSRIKLAWETHYVGDLRAINNGILDTYQLKSLDGALNADIRNLEFRKSDVDDRIYLTVGETSNGPVGTRTDERDNASTREGYDTVISCLGFKFDHSILANATFTPAGKGKINKYPRISYRYESTDLNGVYLAGTSTHSLDFGKGAGGFIHGFRYTARTLHYILENRIEGNPWPFVQFGSAIDVVPHLIKRVSEGSDFYQMFGVLCDVIIIGEDGLTMKYLESYPCTVINRLQEISGHIATNGIILISLEFGKNFSGPGKDPFGDHVGRSTSFDAHTSCFLHPILYYYKSLPSSADVLNRPKKWIVPVPDKLHHIVEDFTTKYDALAYNITPLRRFFEEIFNLDLRHFFIEHCMAAQLTHVKVPESCRQYGKLGGIGVGQSKTVKDTIFRFRKPFLRRLAFVY